MPTAPGLPAGKSAASCAASPTRCIGWKAGDTGSLLEPPSYQKLEGDFINGKDPAENA